MEVTLAGIKTLVRASHEVNAPVPMLVTPEEIVKLVNPPQDS